ncbi:PP2C family protein-serine/threonine phosphatase [Kordiimonas marina]|uniref:PP2C family protein-serine/threonine phosphatase n=1 Tax=Kordiimonas marina TaxID=2872312 RepID=UPI001FF466F0|nr:fused response regulator/phosphatase [Kordiimonas marina]MCJ9429129.1 fused response regulator/phosphatase [Kordiimonas marina]
MSVSGNGGEQKLDGTSAMRAGIEVARILIVDDMMLMRQMIGACLTKGGFTNLAYAEDGEQALEIIAADPPDILILDLKMPKLSGYDVCRKLRADKKTAHLPILVQSASETAQERVEVFAVGATDFVSKPINQPELLARVRMHLENRFLINRLSSFRERMSAELTLAREMQHSLLPEASVLKAIEAACDCTIEAFYQASFELGGDLWGCWLLPENKLGLFILDISGHGVGAALNTFRVHATMTRLGPRRSDPAAFLTALNEALQPHFPIGQFGTMFYGVLDRDSGELTYAGAGAPRPMVVGEGGVRYLDTTGIPVGILSNPDYENRQERLATGESLFCYSDALTEAPAPDGSFLGEAGLAELLTAVAGEGPRATMVKRLLDRFYETRSRELPDDMTAVAIHCNAEGAGA